MGFASENETKSNSNRRMGFLLVFFPDQNNTGKPNLLSSSASSSSSSSSITSKTQSTISICALLLFLTFFLFTTTSPSISTSNHRRLLLTRGTSEITPPTTTMTRPERHRLALQGMGTLFLRGTRAMHDLVVAHVSNDVSEDELRLFIRLLHRSGVTSKSDVVFLLESGLRYDSLIREENNAFLKLADMYQRGANGTGQVDPVWGFNVTRFLKHGKETAEPLWGRRSGYYDRAGNDSKAAEVETGLVRLSHGSVVGFDVSELDPENSLSGFLDHVPVSLRRWACYPMLLGRVRHNFKHVTLVDSKTSLVLTDPSGRVKNRSPDSVIVFPKRVKNSDRTQSNAAVNPAVIVGGAKGIRRLANAMLTEIVRAAMQHKKKGSVTETAVLSQLVGKVHITKNFEVIVGTELVPEASSLTESRLRNSVALKDSCIFQRGNHNHVDINKFIMKKICMYEIDSTVYTNCYQEKEKKLQE